jgi:protein arginine kinase activator
MLCNICNENEATVHLTQMLEGEIKKMDMCESCAQKQGVDDPSGISLVDLLVGLGPTSTEPQPKTTTAPITGLSSCPKCGYTQADLKKTGRLGCSECYTTFEEGLDQMLRSMHKGVRHNGKSPKGFRNTRELKAKTRKLEKELEKAIKDERYEDAAIIRDSIKALANAMSEFETEAATS